ncbi:MAG: Clp protease N-terminal domain-containing protein [Anaerolineae bacterium]|nr:Clp protease N-terminal domain-containing protein [Anaerolineae bacterium]
MAIDEANRFDYQYVGSEHLLAGLLREDKGLACRVLKEMDISLDKVRSQMRLNQKEKMLASPEHSASNQASVLAKLGRMIGLTKKSQANNANLAERRHGAFY